MRMNSAVIADPSAPGKDRNKALQDNKKMAEADERKAALAEAKAVLEAESHDFIFMCAREDFSGYHAFAKTNREHERNARRYRRALDRQGVYR